MSAKSYNNNSSELMKNVEIKLIVPYKKSDQIISEEQSNAQQQQNQFSAGQRLYQPSEPQAEQNEMILPTIIVEQSKRLKTCKYILIDVFKQIMQVNCKYQQALKDGEDPKTTPMINKDAVIQSTLYAIQAYLIKRQMLGQQELNQLLQIQSELIEFWNLDDQSNQELVYFRELINFLNEKPSRLKLDEDAQFDPALGNKILNWQIQDQANPDFIDCILAMIDNINQFRKDEIEEVNIRLNPTPTESFIDEVKAIMKKRALTQPQLFCMIILIAQQNNYMNVFKEFKSTILRPNSIFSQIDLQ